LVVAPWREQSTEIDLVLIKRANTVREPGIDHACTKPIVRPLGYHAGEHNSEVDFDIDQIAVRRTDRGAIEYRDPAFSVTTRWPIQLLVEDAVNCEITTMHERHTAAHRAG